MLRQRGAPHAPPSLSTQGERKQPDQHKRIESTEHTFPASPAEKSERKSHPNTKKSTLLKSHFSSPHLQLVTQILNRPPLEGRTTELGHQQYPSPRMQRLHRDFSDMHDGTALTAQHSPAENVPYPTQSSLPPTLLEKLNLYLYLIFINLNLNSHM